MSLRKLINIRILVSILFVIIISGVFATWSAKKSVSREVESSLNLALSMVGLGFSNMLEDESKKISMIDRIELLEDARHLNISVLEDGKITDIIKSNKDASDRTPKWFERIVKGQYSNKEYLVKTSSGKEKIIISSADPADEISEAWYEFLFYVSSMLIMAIILFTEIHVVFNSALKAVSEILRTLKRAQKGKYEQQNFQFDIQELDLIGNEVSTLCAKLSKTKEENQSLAKHTMLIQENERKHLSRELHDEMGQSLTAIKALAVAVKQDNTDKKFIGDSIVETCDHMIKVVRSMMKTLHPLSLSELGLRATLESMIEDWDRRNQNIDIEFIYDDQIEKLEYQSSIHIYRIIQECLTNIVRHAKAKNVTIKISLTQSKKHVNIVVKDNGVGIKDTRKNGFGMLSMRERVENLNGTLKYSSYINKGLEVKALIPYIEEEKNANI